MIVQLMNEGQFRVDDDLLQRLDRLDDEAVEALERATRRRSTPGSRRCGELVESKGERLPEETCTRRTDRPAGRPHARGDARAVRRRRPGLIPELPTAQARACMVLARRAWLPARALSSVIAASISPSEPARWRLTPPRLQRGPCRRRDRGPRALRRSSAAGGERLRRRVRHVLDAAVVDELGTAGRRCRGREAESPRCSADGDPARESGSNHRRGPRTTTLRRRGRRAASAMSWVDPLAARPGPDVQRRARHVEFI